MRRTWLGGFLAALVGITAAPSALASSGIDSPENGVLQLGRGGAWVARADDPLAAYFNPAGLSRQSSGVHLGAHLMFMKRCFTRLGADGQPVSPGAGLPGPGFVDTTGAGANGPDAELCGETHPFPNPQLAASFRINRELAIGLSVGGPHGVGKAEWAESIPWVNKFGVATTQPAPQRYMLVSSDSTILLPTLSVSYAFNDQISVGVGFVWGVALIEFVNFTEATSPPPAMGEIATDNFAQHLDVKAKLNAKDLFIPGFVIGGLWSPTKNLDVGAWVKWLDAVDSKADLHAESLYWGAGGQKNDDPCNVKNADPMDDLPGGATCNITDAPGTGDLLFRLPMEAKLGVRYHHPRPGVAKPTWASRNEKPTRDTLTDDLFDAELDFTYAHNSVVKDLELYFPSGIKINGTPGYAPTDSSVAHHWNDVVGVRLGGDFVVLPGRLALRVGGFYESQGQDDEYLNIDFHLGSRVGVGGGGTVRLGPVDVSIAYQHTFFGELNNGGKGALKGISGDLTTGNRTQQAVNGGSLRTSLNEAGLAGTLHF